MLGAIDDIERYPALGLNYFNISDNPKVVIDRMSQTGKRRQDEQMNHEMQPDIILQREEQATTKNVFEDRKLVVERYDKNGKLIRMTPPGYIPFDQIAHSVMV